VDVADVQVTLGSRLQRASCDCCEDGAEQQIGGAVGEVVVAAALVGAQDGQLVAASAALAPSVMAGWGMDPGVLAGAQRAQERGPVRGVLELAEDEHVDRVARELGQDRFAVWSASWTVCPSASSCPARNLRRSSSAVAIRSVYCCVDELGCCCSGLVAMSGVPLWIEGSERVPSPRPLAPFGGGFAGSGPAGP
jgi:hypothetical protein